MNLLLLLSALLSALTGANGATRVLDAPAVAARMAESASAETQAQAAPVAHPVHASVGTPRVIAWAAFALTAIIPTYHDRRRE